MRKSWARTQAQKQIDWCAFFNNQLEKQRFELLISIYVCRYVCVQLCIPGCIPVMYTSLRVSACVCRGGDTTKAMQDRNQSLFCCPVSSDGWWAPTQLYGYTQVVSPNYWYWKITAGGRALVYTMINYDHIASYIWPLLSSIDPFPFTILKHYQALSPTVNRYHPLYISHYCWIL